MVIKGGVGGTLEFDPETTTTPQSPVPDLPSSRPSDAPASIPQDATNIVQLPDGSWIWNNADGTRSVLKPDGTKYNLDPNQSVTDPANFEEEDIVEGGDNEQQFDNELMAELTEALALIGLDTPELVEFARQAVSNGWSVTEFMVELRKHPGYLANPLFAANLERTKNGERFMSEAEVLSWATESRRIAQQYGYNAPSDNYLASGLLSGLSLSEIEHRFQIQDRINVYGAGVMMAAKEYGFDLDDADLFEIFDPEKDTKEWEDMFRRAQMRGRPLTLGLGIRSEEEARALEMLGVDPEEAWKRYSDVAGNASRFARLGTIEENIRKGLPPEFGIDLSTQDNSLLLRGLLFNDPAALAELQDVTMREVARWKQGGGAVSSQGGQQIGLLSDEERASYG